MSLARRHYVSNTLNVSCGSSHVRTDAQTKIYIEFCMLLRHVLHNEPVHEIMVPLEHATSECSDEPAHPYRLARGITTHIHIEGTCLKLIGL